MSKSLEGGQPPSPRFGRIDAGLDQVKAAAARARDFLFSLQHPDGYWCGELEADTTLESDYIMVHTLLGTGDERKMRRACTEILRKQNEDGGWSIYAGGPSNISLTVKCYFAGKLMGISPDRPLGLISKGRGLQVPDTPEQAEWLAGFATALPRC